MRLAEGRHFIYGSWKDYQPARKFLITTRRTKREGTVGAKECPIGETPRGNHDAMVLKKKMLISIKFEGDSQTHFQIVCQVARSRVWMGRKLATPPFDWAIYFRTRSNSYNNIDTLYSNKETLTGHTNDITLSNQFEQRDLRASDRNPTGYRVLWSITRLPSVSWPLSQTDR